MRGSLRKAVVAAVGGAICIGVGLAIATTSNAPHSVSVVQAGGHTLSITASLSSPVMQADTVRLDPENTLDPYTAAEARSDAPIGTLVKQVTNGGTFSDVISAASSASSEFALYTHIVGLPHLFRTPVFVAIFRNVPFSAFAHGGMPGEALSNENTVFTYYVVVDAHSGRLLASFDEGNAA
jgi:hypothetical protein